jgi:hypothetical protein
MSPPKTTIDNYPLPRARGWCGTVSQLSILVRSTYDNNLRFILTSTKLFQTLAIISTSLSALCRDINVKLRPHTCFRNDYSYLVLSPRFGCLHSPQSNPSRASYMHQFHMVSGHAGLSGRLRNCFRTEGRLYIVSIIA